MKLNSSKARIRVKNNATNYSTFLSFACFIRRLDLKWETWGIENTEKVQRIHRHATWVWLYLKKWEDRNLPKPCKRAMLLRPVLCLWASKQHSCSDSWLNLWEIVPWIKNLKLACKILGAQSYCLRMCENSSVYQHHCLFTFSSECVIHRTARNTSQRIFID